MRFTTRVNTGKKKTNSPGNPGLFFGHGLRSTAQQGVGAVKIKSGLYEGGCTVAILDANLIEHHSVWLALPSMATVGLIGPVGPDVATASRAARIAKTPIGLTVSGGTGVTRSAGAN